MVHVAEAGTVTLMSHFLCCCFYHTPYPQIPFHPAPFLKLSSTNFQPTPQAGLCCPSAASCVYAKPSTYGCNCGEGETFHDTGCYDTESQCRDYYMQDKTCNDPWYPDYEYHCTEYFLQPCSAYCDKDNDGWYAVECGGVDCNDMAVRNTQ